MEKNTALVRRNIFLLLLQKKNNQIHKEAEVPFHLRKHSVLMSSVQFTIKLPVWVKEIRKIE